MASRRRRGGPQAVRCGGASTRPPLRRRFTVVDAAFCQWAGMGSAACDLPRTRWTSKSGESGIVGMCRATAGGCAREAGVKRQIGFFWSSIHVAQGLEGGPEIVDFYNTAVGGQGALAVRCWYGGDGNHTEGPQARVEPTENRPSSARVPPFPGVAPKDRPVSARNVARLARGIRGAGGLAQGARGRRRPFNRTPARAPSLCVEIGNWRPS